MLSSTCDFNWGLRSVVLRVWVLPAKARLLSIAHRNTGVRYLGVNLFIYIWGSHAVFSSEDLFVLQLYVD